MVAWIRSLLVFDGFLPAPAPPAAIPPTVEAAAETPAQQPPVNEKAVSDWQSVLGWRR